MYECHFSGRSSSAKIAETGQTGTHAPQSMHSTGSMKSWSTCSNPGRPSSYFVSFFGWMQSTGQASTQAVSFVPIQGSAMMYATAILLSTSNGPTYPLLVLRRYRSLLKHLSVPDATFACVARQLEVLGQLKSIHRTGVLTEPTEHAAREVVGERRQVLATGLLVPHAGYHNQVFRAGQRAKIAGDAKRFIGVGIDIESWRTPIAFGYFGPLRRILLSVDVFGTLIPERNP